jgi:Ran GTPase-activating protein 1
MSVVIEGSRKIFEFSGGREAVVTTERAEALIQAIDVKDPSHIHLSNKSFSSEAAIFIAKRLSTFKKIEIADISDIIAGRAEEDALLTLKTICESIVGNKLIELNVSDNALGSKGVTACQSLFVCKSLKRLYACNNGLSADACVLVSELLLKDGCPELTTLHFYNNMSGDGGAVAIAGTVHCSLGVTL